MILDSNTSDLTREVHDGCLCKTEDTHSFGAPDLNFLFFFVHGLFVIEILNLFIPISLIKLICRCFEHV